MAEGSPTLSLPSEAAGLISLEAGPSSDEDLKLICQGAEGRAFAGLFKGQPAVFKERFSKKYRHPVLDEKLTRKRLMSEHRCLQRCKKAGIRVPEVLHLDDKNSRIIMELVPGCTARAFLNDPANASLRESVIRGIGSVLASLHNAGVVHGDPTTSNLMVTTLPRSSEGTEAAAAGGPSLDPFQITLIDFGLASGSTNLEDRAVDLYVLERAFVSTHPSMEHMFGMLLDAYFALADKGGEVKTRYQTVRARGRKRTAFG